MRAVIVPGGIFPNYELPDHTGQMRKLTELQGEDSLILTLARGHYCPKEHQQHLKLAAFYPKIAVAYTQIATIATDDHHTHHSRLGRWRCSGFGRHAAVLRVDRRASHDRNLPAGNRPRPMSAC